jgi:hypothetical protein
MTNNPYLRSALVKTALGIAPPLIQKSLLEDPGFRIEYHLQGDGVLSLGNPNFIIQRSELYEAVRAVLSGASLKEVTNVQGQKWDVKYTSEEGELPRLTLSYDTQHLFLPDLAVLSLDSSVRLRSFDETASTVNLSYNDQDTWRAILLERPLDDDEVDIYYREISDTPIEKARSIKSMIGREPINISSLIPSSRRYYERLVGVYDGSTSIREFATGGGRALIAQLIKWRLYEGLLFSLLLSSHSSMTGEINVDLLEKEDLIRAFDFLDKHGDRISQLGAIEVGLRVLPATPDIEPFLISLIEQIRDDDVEKQSRGFNLFSALFILVDGELSRTRLLSTEPPFYRKLAALTQAALIHRQLANSTVDEKFCEWALNNGSWHYYLQSLSDIRLEPRWNPDFAAASQMKADFFGRIMIAANIYKQNIKVGSQLSDLIVDNKSNSLRSLSDFIHPYLPGPLEGSEESPISLPTELSEAIEHQLVADEVGPSSFYPLVNSALIFRVNTNQAELAARALKLANYRLAHIEDRLQLIGVLNGLATVAAVTRSSALADELRILVRKYRRDAQIELSIEEAVRICLTSAASHANIDDWGKFVGEWLTEFAFNELKDDEGAVLYKHIQYLCHVVPELWFYCGRADAALEAYNASRPPGHSSSF